MRPLGGGTQRAVCFMKLLFTSANSASQAEVGVLSGLLDEAGIACEIRNERSPYPQAPFDPELWVIDDNDFPQAAELRDVWRHPPAVAADTWACPGCGEQVDGQFAVCWKCGKNRKGESMEAEKLLVPPTEPAKESPLNEHLFTIALVALAGVLLVAIANPQRNQTPPFGSTWKASKPVIESPPPTPPTSRNPNFVPVWNQAAQVYSQDNDKHPIVRHEC